MKFEEAVKLAVMENKKIREVGNYNHTIIHKDTQLWCIECNEPLAPNQKRFRKDWEIVEEKKDEKKEDYKDMTYAALIRILNKELNLNITDIKVRGMWIEKPEEETFKLCYEVKQK